MTKLKVPARGQAVLPLDVLKPIGLQPGGTIGVEPRPGGRAELKADEPGAPGRQVFGMLNGKGNGAILSIEEIGEANAEAGARAAMAGLDEAYDRGRTLPEALRSGS